MNRAREGLAEVRKLRNKLIAQVDSDYYLKEELIRLRYENQNLKEENKELREKHACDGHSISQKNSQSSFTISETTAPQICDMIQLRR